MYTIAQAAQILGVAAVTLRLWERQGKITSSRTAGGQRRYSGEDLAAIRNLINQPRILPAGRQASPTPPLPRPKLHLTLPQNRVLFATAAALIISAAGFASIKSGLLSNITPFNPPLNLRGGNPKGEGDIKKFLSFFRRPTSISTAVQGAVLASQTRFEDLLFKVNIPAEFARDITAPNILYGLKAGTGVKITGDTQNPTISAGNSFGGLKTGSTTLSATTSADLLTFTAGTGISLSADTTTNKLTVTNSLNLDDAGWKDDGTIVRLTTPGDIVAIGAASGAAKLNLNTDDLRDLITASQAGSLKFKLTSDGNITAGTYNSQTISSAANFTGTLALAGILTTSSSASISGALKLYGTPTIQSTANQSLTLGGDTTGNISIVDNIVASGTLTGLTGLTVSSGTVSLPDGQIDNAELAGSIAASKLIGTDIATVGTITTGTWTATKISEIYGGTNQSTYTTGDLLYSSATNTLSKLGIGSDGQALTVSSGVPIWAGGTGSGTVGWWQRNLGVLAPTNISDDLAVGGTATSSAKFQVFGATGNITTSGDLALNGADLTTTATTFNLVNATATTVNFAGAATTLGIGAATGTTDVKNSLNVTSDLDIDGGDLTASTTSFNLLQSTVTTLNLGGAATTVSLGASTGTTTINNANTVISGDLAVNGGDLTSSSTTFNFVTGATTLNIGAATGTTTINNALSVSGAFTLGDDGDTGSINTSDWDIGTTGNLSGIGNITADGAIAFSPASTSDITFTTDSDSTFVVSGLSTATGSGLCLDGSNNVIICSSGSGSSLWTLSSSTVYLNLATYDALIGSITAADGVGKLTVSGAKTGKALVIFNETGNQNILEASASGVPILSLERDGDFVFEGVTNNDFETTLAVSDPSADRAVTIPNASGTICLDTNNCTGGTAGPWDETAGLVLLDTITNNVVIGGSTNLAKLAIDGDTDEIQFLIQGNATQTSNLLTLENSGATDLSWFDESGNLRIGTSAADTGLVNVTGAFTGKALLILNETGDQNILAASASGTTVMTLGRTGNLALTVSSSSNADINLSSTGDFTISDAGTPYATFSDTGYLDLDSLRLDGTTIGLTTDTDLLSLAANELTINGSIVATADVAVNGGDLTSSATTFNLLNATVTTLNLGGAATILSVGGGSGTTTINNALTITGTLTANGAFTLGDNGDIGAINTSDWDVNSTGDMTGIGSVTMDGNFSQTGTGTLGTGTGAVSLNGDVTVAAGKKLGVGGAATGLLDVSGAVTGKALAILNETGDQNILTASASGTTKFTFDRTGNLKVAAGGSLDVLAAGGLTLGSSTATAITLSTDGTGDAEVVLPTGAISTGEILDNTVTATDLNATLTFAALDFVDLASIVHNTTALQGLRLPQIGTSPSNPTSGEGFIGWDETANAIKIYNGTSWASVGGGTTQIVLSPEYPGAIISADGTTNVGTLTSDREATGSGNLYSLNYYEFSSGQTTLQDYDVYVRWEVPDNWTAWTTSNALTIDYATEDTSSANNKIDIQVTKDSDADTVTSTANVSPTAGKWQSSILSSSPISFTAAQLNTGITWAAGDVMIVRLRLYSKDNYFARVGAIKFDW